MLKMMSVGQIAKMFGTARSTVIRWIQNGILPSFETRGGDNRIILDDLYAFIKKHKLNFRIKGDKGRFRIVISDENEKDREKLVEILKKKYAVKTAETWYETGRIVREFKPHVLIINICHPDEIEIFKNALALDPGCYMTKIIGVTKVFKVKELELARQGYHAFFPKPVKKAQLETAVASLLPGKTQVHIAPSGRKKGK